MLLKLNENVFKITQDHFIVLYKIFIGIIPSHVWGP